ncbi:methyltransferase domain-containing protein [Staphylococcus chromogenes]|uniref:methyltransferase domain-containing protein n=1 Tax=Staphylococcus chromogenes TaxID=46126 RepID=UPI002888A00F|nr:methyltransferase domain-containing protein [Staphylococcus chromogenes]MDT0700339.1 methyltransferase domain-containing protein [Staphylococcus chromogenes]
MNLKKSNWVFNEEVTKQFSNHVRASVPFYDEFHTVILELSRWFVEPKSNIYDLGASKGELISLLQSTHNNVNFIAIENSKSMANSLRENFKQSVKIIEKDLTDETLTFTNTNFIISMLTMQFIELSKRQNLFNKIYKGLHTGGAFILVEKIHMKDSLIQNLSNGLLTDFKLKNLSKEHIVDKERSIRGVLKPVTLQDNFNYLSNAGFKKYEVILQWGNFVGIIAIK